MASASVGGTAPNREGNGGTTPGTYDGSVSGFALNGYVWNFVTTSTTFTIS